MSVLPENDDPDYFIRRAETQLELAQRSAHPAVVAAHYVIANSYIERDANVPTAPAAND